MALGPGRSSGVVRDVASTTAQRGFPSRRASGIGGTGFVPTHLPGCELWLDAADTDTITSSSGAVSQWNDKSGFGRNVSQATGSRQPGTGAQTQNGLNVLTFDGGDWLDTASATVIVQPFMLFAVGYHTSASNTTQTRMFCNVDNQNVQLISGVFFSTATASYTGTDFATAGTYSAATWQVLGAQADGARSFALANNVAGTVFDSGTQSFRLGRVGARFSSPTGTELGLIGRIAEVLAFSSPLTVGQRTALQNYFGAKWGL